jgi:RNA polymerase sigma-70 factor (ECF subfamily)
MPPMPFEYRGVEAARRFFTTIRPSHSRFDRLVPVRANGQPAWGAYQRDSVAGTLRLTSIFVITLAGSQVSELIRFETTLAPYFCLPRTLD